MVTWTAKDPDAVQDYLYEIPLDALDSVASYTLTKISGDVVLDSDANVGPLVTAWLSGGTDGSIGVFRVAWQTAAGRADDDLITIAIITRQPVELELTGYAKPAPAHLILRYPAFAKVEPTIIAYWLKDAERYVDQTWLEGDYAAALMAMAAHNMSLSGEGKEAEATSDLPAGITSMKIGTLGLSFDSAITRDKASGALSSTRYGSEFATLRRKSHAGPRVMGTGVVCGGGARFPMGEW